MPTYRPKPRPKSKSRILGLNAFELAEELGVSLFTIKTWKAKGIIPYLQIDRGMTRYQLPEVLEALNRQFKVTPK